MYEVTGSQLTDSLTTANPTVFTADTVELILDLATTSTTGPVSITQVTAPASGEVTVPAGAGVALVAIANSGTTVITPPADLPVIVFESATGSVEVEFDGGTVQKEGIDRVVIGAGGSDKIVVKDTKDTHVDGGSGNDSITTGGGNDSIIGGQGNDSLAAGTGNDTIVAGVGNDTVDGGQGFDVVATTGSVADYTVTVANGQMTMTKTDGTVINLDNVQYVQLDNGEAIIAAKSKTEVAVTALYEAILGRTADAAGLEWWFNAANNGASMDSIAHGFVNSSEATTGPAKTDATWLTELYQKTFNRSVDQGGFDFWSGALENGVSRAHVAAMFAQVAADNVAGTVQTEVTTVGYVNIISDII